MTRLAKHIAAALRKASDDALFRARATVLSESEIVAELAGVASAAAEEFCRLDMVAMPEGARIVGWWDPNPTGTRKLVMAAELGGVRMTLDEFAGHLTANEVSTEPDC